MNAVVLTRSIGRNVRVRRIAKGFSQRQLAEVAGISERLVRSLEAGNARGIGLEKLAAVLTPLDLDLRLAGADGLDVDLSADPVAQPDEYSALLSRMVSSWTEGECADE